ncbi:MAG TPA: carboxypeptidase regulatory-like domain-containing protein [Gammaproteobacteria bacterium]|nr:carboxypeptidase regulatory-like domain-containing protein [Gammaproteobacteria bacterium]
MTKDNSLLIINKLINCLITISVLLLISGTANARDIVRGKVVDMDGAPVKNMRVKAVDKDSTREQEMGKAFTNEKGEYLIKYTHKHWDSCCGKDRRPDIRVYLSERKPAGGFKRRDQSKVYKNWVMKKDLVVNFTIKNIGICPYPADFKTTKVWRGCSCPTGTYKRWLDYAKYKARCANGVSPKAECEKKRTYVWYGTDNNHGLCVKPMNVVAIHRQAYYAYFKKIGKGVKMERLPGWVIKRYDRFFPNIALKDVLIGEYYNNPKNTSTITDCKKIYFPVTRNKLARIRTEKNPDYYLLLHELAHTDQCMGLKRGNYSTRRDKYADMWFSQLPKATIVSILSDGILLDNSIHDKMPMEKQADQKAREIIAATGIGTSPVIRCPDGVFSTRTFRNCECLAGTKKQYSDFLKSRAQCVRPNKKTNKKNGGRSSGEQPGVPQYRN